MSLQAVEPLGSQGFSSGTSAGGALRRARDIFIVASGALSVSSTTSDESTREWTEDYFTVANTTGGQVVETSNLAASAAIAELRLRSGLTWDQLARLLGVARRSVHFWASGKPLNAANEERVGRLLAVIRHIDRGEARKTRTALLSPLDDGTVPFDLLMQEQFDLVADRLGAGLQRVPLTLTPLSSEAQAARKPSPPDARVDAYPDSVHRDVGGARPARTVKAKRER